MVRRSLDLALADDAHEHVGAGLHEPRQQRRS